MDLYIIDNKRNAYLLEVKNGLNNSELKSEALNNSKCIIKAVYKEEHTKHGDIYTAIYRR